MDQGETLFDASLHGCSDVRGLRRLARDVKTEIANDERSRNDEKIMCSHSSCSDVLDRNDCSSFCICCHGVDAILAFPVGPREW